MRTSTAPTLSALVAQLEGRGRFTFTTDEAQDALGVSATAARSALRRLKAKGHLADPHRGFHVIVPPAYRALGCLPAEQFVPELMAHLGLRYYVGLLSAARYHGAGHQAPMALTVMIESARRPIECGQVRVDFVARRDMHETPTVERNTPAGTLRVASPQATALELVGYPERSGYLDNVATVLGELAERLEPDSLEKEARRAPAAWAQRLGVLLAMVEADELAARVEASLEDRRTFPVALAPWEPMRGAPRDARWKVALNTTVEPDL